ncbi:hypothetical protein GCM10011579_065530 [Streptomyces albiflavescens]|uniref:Acyltransferase 3 domain-containing protein n=1 Tax=Streptomyces albiflavescens TaxID=1623582 RepID=A0A918D828_9ACTN|nr:acyltransferase family protein [Streptomyces albiflavescens]GGN80206.1 hypothetical protein GCM10011579_065530 [Streptomyces albiflavescens]
MLLAVGICTAVGADPDTLALVGWAMAMQFWFLPVYLLLSALTPLLHAVHRRWGLLVPVAMGAAAVAADALVAIVHAPYAGLLNYVLVWGVAYQLGFCWRDGLLTRRRLVAAVLAVGGGLAFAALVALGPFPVSLLLVTGQTPSNTNPPSAAMLAWAVAQVGLCLLAAPAVRRLLQHERVWRVVRPVGGASMTLYLWHMLPVLVVAAAFYLTGLAPEPLFGSAAWWGLRVPWLLVLGVVLAGVVPVLRPWSMLWRCCTSGPVRTTTCAVPGCCGSAWPSASRPSRVLPRRVSHTTAGSPCCPHWDWRWARRWCWSLSGRWCARRRNRRTP